MPDIIKSPQITNYRSQTNTTYQQTKNDTVGSGNLVNQGQGQPKFNSSNQGKDINSGKGKNLNRGLRDYFSNLPRGVGLRNREGKPIRFGEIPKTVKNNLGKLVPK